MYHVGIGSFLRITDKRGKLALEVEVGHFVAIGIPVEDAVEADADVRNNVGATGQIGLQASASADTHQFERMMLGTNLTGLEVDVLEGIELVHHNINIVGADAMAYGRDALALIGTCDGMEFAGRDFALPAVEVGGNQVNTSWVTTHDDLVGQLVGTNMQVETAAIRIDY